jgi:hypothetical protein
MEAGPVSETLRFLFIYNFGRWAKSINPAILSVMHHRQNHLESASLIAVSETKYDDGGKKNYILCSIYTAVQRKHETLANTHVSNKI